MVRYIAWTRRDRAVRRVAIEHSGSGVVVRRFCEASLNEQGGRGGFAAKQIPPRPRIAPALGLRAGPG